MVNTDHVAGRLGSLVRAPVGRVRIVDVPQQLIDNEQQMQHMPSGLAHGNEWIDGCTDRENLRWADEGQNRTRFARLAVFYGWILANDHQFIYRTNSPHTVYSVDHGHFLPGRTGWTAASLGAAGAPEPDARIVTAVQLGVDELTNAARHLARATDAEIASAIATPPADWGMDKGDREALLAYLSVRRDELLSRFGLLDEGAESDA